MATWLHINPVLPQKFRIQLESTMKLSFITLLLAKFGSADHCLLCNYVGYADSEATAIAMLSGDSTLNTDTGKAGHKSPYCATLLDADFKIRLNGANAKEKYQRISDKAYCIAQFFIYYAKDINK